MTSDRTPPLRVTVEDAAKLMGLSVDAVRKRIERGKLKSEKDEGTRYVLLTSDAEGHDYDRSSQDYDMTPGSAALVASLQEQIEYLRQEVEDWKEEARRKDHLLAAALERIPAIEEAPPEPRESDIRATEGRDKDDAPPEPETSRSWLSRFFFGAR